MEKDLGNFSDDELKFFKRKTTGGKVSIIDYNGTAIDIVIPSEIKGKPVTSIGQNAFSNLISLQSITIPDTVTSIGYKAFSCCTKLKSITIPDSVTSIGENAFYGCSSLQSITIPDSVTSIDSNAFSNCKSLNEVYISSIEAWLNIDFMSYNSNPLCNGAKLYLNDELVENLVIPDGIENINNYAFCGNSIKSITIPNSVTNIDSGAFMGCNSLTEIIVGANNENYCVEDSVLFNKNKTTLICYPIGKTESSYAIPNTVTSIGSDAFWGCDSLENITIPDSVTSIGADAFWGCGSLENITIPDSVISIGPRAFVYTGYYQNESNWKSDMLYIGKNLVSSEDLPVRRTVKKGTRIIAGCAFADSFLLETITIPNSVTHICDEAFLNCTLIETVNYAGTQEQWDNIVIGFGNEDLTNATINFKK